MDTVRGTIVLSKSGRDKGSFLVILEADHQYCLLADGKRRPLDRPKKKKRIHLAFTNSVVGEEVLQSNRQLRKTLNAFTAKAEKTKPIQKSE